MIRHYRKKKLLSQEQLAQLAGITKDHIAKIERGKNTNVTINNLVKISEALGIPVTDLLQNKSGEAA